jgi:hypothetical protein
MLDTFTKMEFCFSDSGVELAKSLIAFVQRHLKILPTLVPDGMRFWLGHDVAKMLDIPAGNPFTKLALRIMFLSWQIEDHFERHIPFMENVSQFIARRLMLGLLLLERGGTRSPFHIPTTLRERLSLGE